MNSKTNNNFIYGIIGFAAFFALIAIPFVIVSWNKSESFRKIEQKIVLEMKSDLSKDLYHVKRNIQHLTSGIQSVSRLNYQLKHQLPYHDSLAIDYAQMYRYVSLKISTSSFESLKSSGFETIKDNHLKHKIISLYNDRYTSMLRQESNIEYPIYIQLLNKIILPNIEKKSYSNAVPYNQNSLFQNAYFKEGTKQLLARKETLVYQYERIDEEIMDLIYYIDKSSQMMFHCITMYL